MLLPHLNHQANHLQILPLMSINDSATLVDEMRGVHLAHAESPSDPLSILTMIIFIIN